MNKWIVTACVLWGGACFGQQPSAISFEVASIKPAQPMTGGRVRIMMNTDKGMLRYTNVALKDVIRVAYRVKDFQVEGPDWMGGARFDIVAKLPDGSSEEQVPEMLQSLLAERFKLTAHRETKEHAIYALVVGKNGAKLKPAEIQTAEGSPKEGAGYERPPGAPAKGGMPPRNAMMMMMDPSGMHLKAPSATLANVAEAISRFTERPVVDMTGIQGQYDFDLVFAPETTRGMRTLVGPPPPGAGAGEGGPSEAPAEPAGSIFDAVQQYGLKLDPRKAPLEIIVVDHVEKTPTEN
jgi:uncharacterized protein (TIGR03435 family)